MDSKRKVEESLALLNSLFAHPNKKHQSSNTTPQELASSRTTNPSGSNISEQNTLSISKTSAFLPPRPPVLDKLSHLSSRQSLKDTIAASIAASAPTSNRRSSGSSPQLPVSTTLQEPTLKSVGPTARNKRSYMPWSRDQFHERLETFKPSTWFDKPNAVNPVECAKRGWINKGNDRLECYGGCGGVVIVRIDLDQEKVQHQENQTISEDNSKEPVVPSEGSDIEMSDAYIECGIKAIGAKLKTMLTENHDTTCPWRVHPCDDNIYKFPVVSLSQARTEFLDRIRSLELMENDKLIETLRHPLLPDQLAQLNSVFPELKLKSLILSLTGWNALGGLNMLACDACHTRCTYIPNTIPSFDQSDASEDAIEDNSFDVIQSHKNYCYWIGSEVEGEREAGWELLFDRLTNSQSSKTTEVSMDKKPSNIEPSEALAQVRRILRGQVLLSPSST